MGLGSEIRKKTYSGSQTWFRVKKASDPVSGSATLLGNIIRDVHPGFRGQNSTGSGSTNNTAKLTYIGICIDLGWPGPDPGEQKLRIIIEKVKNFHVLKCWMFFCEG
jgi:hypothetical protein